jgi:hypothetical protein
MTSDVIADGSWRVGVHQDYPTSGLRLVLARPWADGRVEVITALTATGPEHVVRDGDETITGDALTIPEGAARALLDALAQHFGGTGDTRQMRRDLDAERRRVDVLTHALITVATIAGGGRSA